MAPKNFTSPLPTIQIDRNIKISQAHSVSDTLL